MGCQLSKQRQLDEVVFVPYYDYQKKVNVPSPIPYNNNKNHVNPQGNQAKKAKKKLQSVGLLVPLPLSSSRKQQQQQQQQQQQNHQSNGNKKKEFDNNTTNLQTTTITTTTTATSYSSSSSSNSSTSIKESVLRRLLFISPHRHQYLLTPYYNKLPKRSKKCVVKSVYDGDTITLFNNNRVRLLGIDTPELNLNQPYAQEAKQYTLQRCLSNNTNIWISYEEGGGGGGTPHQDRFGRLLCWVWVAKTTKANDDDDKQQQQQQQYECINEGLISSGLATVYAPSKGIKICKSKLDKLISLQKQARLSRRGIWNQFVDRQVVVTKYGTAYHHRDCQCEHLIQQQQHNNNTLNNNNNNKTTTRLIPILASQAMDQGKNPCRSCLAN